MYTEARFQVTDNAVGVYDDERDTDEDEINDTDTDDIDTIGNEVTVKILK